MTIEEFDRISSELNDDELIDFINRNPRVANEWAERLLKEIRYLDVTLDEETSQEIWNGIVQQINQRERFLQSRYFVCFKNIILFK